MEKRHLIPSLQITGCSSCGKDHKKIQPPVSENENVDYDHPVAALPTVDFEEEKGTHWFKCPETNEVVYVTEV